MEILNALLNRFQPHVTTLDSRRIAFVPKDHDVKDLSHLMDRAPELHRDFKTDEIQSVVEYYKEFKHLNLRSRAYASDLGIKVIIDDHKDGITPSRERHHIHFSAQPSTEWRKWRCSDTVALSQSQFCELLEDAVDEVIEPAGSDLLALISNFKETRNMEFTSATNVSSGEVVFAFSNTKASNNVAMPQKIAISIPVFKGFDRYKVEAKLRYRLESHPNAIQGPKQLKFWYELDRPDDLEEAVFKDMCEDVQEKAGFKLFFGSA